MTDGKAKILLQKHFRSNFSSTFIAYVILLNTIYAVIWGESTIQVKGKTKPLAISTALKGDKL